MSGLDGIPSDEELMTRAAGGEVDAFEQLVQRHQRSASRRRNQHRLDRILAYVVNRACGGTRSIFPQLVGSLSDLVHALIDYLANIVDGLAGCTLAGAQRDLGVVNGLVCK